MNTSDIVYSLKYRLNMQFIVAKRKKESKLFKKTGSNASQIPTFDKRNLKNSIIGRTDKTLVHYKALDIT